MKHLVALIFSFWLLIPASAALAAPSSKPHAAAPELAQLGSFAVGVTETQWQTAERNLRVVIWYPASLPGAVMRYPGELPAAHGGASIPFSTEALATRDATPIAGRLPTIIFSHGFGSRPERHAWLNENLASKGYIVIAPDHADRAFTQPGAFSEAIVRRAPDIAGVAARALKDPAWAARIDAARLGLVGYSMGGYGALRIAGAAFNKTSATTRFVPPGALDAQLEGGALDRGPLIANLKAMVLLAPWGGQSSIAAFTPAALAKITTPTLFLSGDRDDISGYEDGVGSLFSSMIGANRSFVTFENGGHTFAADALPPEGSGVFMYEEFFEDPVWRKERLHGISQHFITAFLDLNVKGDTTRAPFLALPNGRSAEGVWPQSPGTPSTGAFAAGQPNVTVWRGFQRRWAESLRYRSEAAARP